MQNEPRCNHTSAGMWSQTPYFLKGMGLRTGWHFTGCSKPIQGLTRLSQGVWPGYNQVSHRAPLGAKI